MVQAMKIIIAMDSFKGTISACEACDIIASAITKNVPNAKLVIKPMADGGEGTAEAMLKSVSGKWVPRTVTGPLPDMTVETGFAWFEDSRTALVEMACTGGLVLLTKEQYNPMKTTTYGTGELIQAALEYNPSKIFLGVGGSATVDGGIGSAAALGWKFLDAKGAQVPLCGAGLEKITEIIKPKETIGVDVEVLCDVKNPLCGEHGAARIYSPQKGATPEMVSRLEAGLINLVKLIGKQLNCDINIPGAGAAGGLAAGAVAFMNAELVSGIKTIIDHSNLEAELVDADWVVTGEGCFDRQSLYGKVVSGVAEVAVKSDTNIAVIAGQVNLSEQEYQKLGIRTVISCKQENISVESSLQNSKELLRLAAERFVRENII